MANSGTNEPDRSGADPLDPVGPDTPAERELRLLKAYLHELIEMSPEAIVFLDNTDRIVRINQEFTRLFGYSPAEAVGRRINDLIVPFDKKEESEDYTARAQAGERFESETVRRRKDGSLVDVSVMANPLVIEGRRVGVYGIYRNISRRKQAEESLLFQKAFLDGLIEKAPEAIVVLDRAAGITRVNHEFEKVFGFSAEEAFGRTLDELIVPETLVEEGLELNRQVLRGDIVSLETVRQRKDGRPVHVSLLSAPITVEGKQIGFLAIYRDIADRVTAEEALHQSETKYGTILEEIEDGYYELDLASRFTYATDVTAKILDVPGESLIGQRFSDFCEKDDVQTLLDTYHQVMTTGEPVRGVAYKVKTHDDRRKTLEASASLIRNKAGSPVGFRGIIRDMTDRRKAEDALRESEERHRMVLETSPVPIMVTDIHHQVTYLNPSFTRLFGFTLAEASGRELDFVPKDNLSEYREIKRSIKRGRSFTGLESRRVTKDWRTVDVSVSGAVFFGLSGKPAGSVQTLQDITNRKMAENELKFVAYHDLLTGLPNRKSFYRTAEETLRQAQRRRSDNQWALMFMDLDRFKHINDSLGHDAGDELLIAVSRRVRECLRRSDYLFRLGGDEFTVILSNLSRQLDVAIVARHVLREVARPYQLKGHDIYTSTSIGISVFPDDGQDVETLVKNADMAMYAAKEEGGGYRFFTGGMQQRAVERMRMESSLRLALENGELVLHYQPLYDRFGGIRGVEALLRWDHPEKGLLSADQFMGMAEDTGTIVPIGKWALETACAWASKWQRELNPDIFLAVNLSPRQFRQDNLTDLVGRVLEKTGLDPSGLVLEVLEGSLMENPEGAARKMNRLREMGIRFSIDNFGTGYSSLGFFRQFPIDLLKIDRGFIDNSVKTKEDREIVKAIISMARSLNISTVAEGVESVEQREMLLDYGCDTMQGFFLARPMTEPDLEKLLRKEAGADNGPEG